MKSLNVPVFTLSEMAQMGEGNGMKITHRLSRSQAHAPHVTLFHAKKTTQMLECLGLPDGCHGHFQWLPFPGKNGVSYVADSRTSGDSNRIP